MMWSLCALVLGFIIDLILGDPHSIPHPVVWIGKLISVLEKGLRRMFPKTVRGGECGRWGVVVDCRGSFCGNSGCTALVVSLGQPVAASWGGEHHVLANSRHQIPAG